MTPLERLAHSVHWWRRIARAKGELSRPAQQLRRYSHHLADRAIANGVTRDEIAAALPDNDPVVALWVADHVFKETIE